MRPYLSICAALAVAVRVDAQQSDVRADSTSHQRIQRGWERSGVPPSTSTPTKDLESARRPNCITTAWASAPIDSRFSL